MWSGSTYPTREAPVLPSLLLQCEESNDLLIDAEFPFDFSHDEGGRDELHAGVAAVEVVLLVSLHAMGEGGGDRGGRCG